MPAFALQVTDETTSGQVLRHLELQLDAERVSVAELIAARVLQEVRAHNAAGVLTRFRGLVEPAEQERALNGPPPAPRPVDAEQQTAVALRAFERGHVLVLVDDRQATELETEVQLTPQSSVTFLKLIPLVGG